VAAKLQNIPEKTYFWVNICKKNVKDLVGIKIIPIFVARITK
jgi:hypothetical protein